MPSPLCTNVKPPRTNVSPPIDEFLATGLTFPLLRYKQTNAGQ